MRIYCFDDFKNYARQHFKLRLVKTAIMIAHLSAADAFQVHNYLCFPFYTRNIFSLLFDLTQKSFDTQSQGAIVSGHVRAADQNMPAYNHPLLKVIFYFIRKSLQKSSIPAKSFRKSV